MSTLKAQKAGADIEANLSVLAFAARSDTKLHEKNTPRFFVSPSLAHAFSRVGIPDIKSFLIHVAYGTASGIWSSGLGDDGALVTSLKQEVARLSQEISSLQTDNVRLANEVKSLKETLGYVATSWHAFLTARLQEVSQLSRTYSAGLFVPTGSMVQLETV